MKKNCLIKNVLQICKRWKELRGENGENDEKLDGHIRDEEYLTCKKVWKEFGTKNMGDVIITIII